MIFTEGTPSVRILVSGTKRILGVVQQDERFSELPENVRAAWSGGEERNFRLRDLFGRYRVCAVTAERSGRMQKVRVTGADRLRVEWTR